MPYKVTQTDLIYKGRVFNVRVDLVELPDGRKARLDIVEHSGAVTLIPLDEDQRIWFVRQYRHAIGREILELPAGVVEEGEIPEECAQREAREEIGMAAGHFQKVGEFFLAPGYSTEHMHVFLATGLYSSPLPVDADEMLSVEQMPVERVYEMVEEGAFQDSKTLAALILAQGYIRNSGK